MWCQNSFETRPARKPAPGLVEAGSSDTSPENGITTGAPDEMSTIFTLTPDHQKLRDTASVRALMFWVRPLALTAALAATWGCGVDEAYAPLSEQPGSGGAGVPDASGGSSGGGAPGAGGNAGTGGNTGGTGNAGGGGPGGAGGAGESAGMGGVGAGGSPGIGCSSLDCLPCGQGVECATEGPFIEGTCCAEGDAIERVGSAWASEVVDLEVKESLAILCGGFGAMIFDVSDPSAPTQTAQASPRCQRAAFGLTLTSGDQIFYLAHHGDSWVPKSFLATYQLDASGNVTELAKLEEPGVLYEGLAHDGDHLYVAAHGGGVRSYSLSPAGVPAFEEQIGGFANAWKLAAAGEHLFVADADTGLVILDVSSGTPTQLSAISTTAPPRDIVVAGGRAYLALGSVGVDVFDVSDPAAPIHLKLVVGDGSVQGVSVAGDTLALASWTHIETWSTSELVRLGTQRTTGSFEQNLGVALRPDGRLFVGEWSGLHVFSTHPGRVAPDLHVLEDIFTLPAAELSARAVVVENRGHLPLEVSQISIDDPLFSLDVDQLMIAPGASDFFQLTAQSPPEGLRAQLQLVSNDPDPLQQLLNIPIEAARTSGINVGDTLDSSFGFLDPSGAGQIDALRGHVTVLAYFALF